MGAGGSVRGGGGGGGGGGWGWGEGKLRNAWAVESVNARRGGLLWKCLRDGVERAIMGFSQRTDTILNSDERRPVMPASGM